MRFLSSRRRLIFLLAGALVLFLYMAGFVLLGGTNLFSRGMDMMFIPDYPGAQQLQVHVADKVKGDGYDYYRPKDPYKVVTFVTADTPSQIFAFYRKALQDRQWEDWRVQSAQEKSDSLYIYGFGEEQISPPMYLFQVKTEQVDGLTHVTVERSYEPGL